MPKAIYEHVIVIGYGVVTGNVLKTVHEKSAQFGYSLEYVEHEIHNFNSAKKYAVSEDIEYHTLESRAELTEYFLGRINRKTLIISVSNNYLFPATLIANNNVTIVNFHNALLPELPGRNAPSWAIFENRDVTGITWHYVISEVDAGDIIVQKECPISQDMKAYELVAQLMQLATEAFTEHFDEILIGTAKTEKQPISENRRLFKSNMIPADGKFDLTAPVENIYRLLRAMDYGKNDIFPMPVTHYNGNTIRIRRYQKVKKMDAVARPDKIYLPLDEDTLLMLRYEIAMPDGGIGGEDI